MIRDPAKEYSLHGRHSSTEAENETMGAGSGTSRKGEVVIVKLEGTWRRWRRTVVSQVDRRINQGEPRGARERLSKGPRLRQKRMMP